MANKISLIFEAIGADKLAQAFGQVSSGAEKAGQSAEKAGQGAAKAGQSAGDAAKHVDVLGLSLNKMAGLAGQAGVDLSFFQKAAAGAHESMAMLAGGFSTGTVAAGTFVTGIAAMTGVLVAASQHLVSSYNEIKTFAAISGMAAGDADDLADAMGAVGVSSQQLSMALFKLEDDAAAGGDALLKLGLTMDDLRTKSAGDLFVATIDKIQALGSQSEKTAALVEIFGARLGRAFAELVREGGMSIDQLKEKVADLSPWTKEMETNARNLAVAQEFLRNAIGGVVDTLGNAFAPILTTAINAMTEWVVSMRKGIENSGVLDTAINMLVDVFKALWEALSPLMPLLKELGLAAVQTGLAMLAAFQGVMIPVVALTGAIGALWAAIQKVASGDFAGALTALKTGLAETEVAVGRQIARFNEQVLANEKLSDSLSGVSTSWEDLGSYTTEAGVAADRAAPSIRKIGDEAKKAADEAKKAAEVIAAWEKSVGQVGLTAALIYDDVNRLRSAMEFDELEASIRGVEALHASLTNLQRGIDAIHMNEAEKELAGFRAELDKIPGLGDAAKEALLNAAAGIIAVRDAAKEGKKELEDAAKYMVGLGTAAETVKAPLENLGQYVGDLEPKAATAAEAMSILTDRVERLIPPNTIESITQYGDALRELKPTAASAATALDILNDRVSESGEASIKAEQRWEKFGDGLKGMFASVGDTFEKITTGLIQGTLDIDEAFKNLGQSLLINFANTVFDSILDEAQGFVDDFIDTIVSGISSFDWGGFFNTVMDFIGGGGGGGGGFSAGDWWDDIGFDMYAHGGLVRRTGPAVLHAGETVVPAGYGSGWQSSGFMPGGGGGGGYGGTIPVRIENVDAFGQQFGSWASKIIGAFPLALQGLGMLTGNAAIGGAGSGLGIMGALRTGYNLYQGGYQMGDYLSPQSIGSLASGIGSLMSLIGGLTDMPALGYAGMGIQGAVLGTQIINSLAPTLIPAISSALSSVFSTGFGPTMSAIGSAFSGAASGLASGGMAGIGASIGSFAAGMAPGAIAFGPGILASILVPMFQKNEEKNYQANRQGMAFTTDLFKGLSSVTMADLTSNESLRSDLGKLAGNLFGTDYANLGRMREQISQDKAHHIQALTEAGADMSLPDTQASIAMYDRQLDVLSKLAEQFQELGIQAEFSSDAIANFGDNAGQMGFNFLEALSNLMTTVMSGTTAANQEVTESNQEVATSANAVVQNQANLILKYGETTERLRLIGEAFGVDLGIPKLMELTAEQLAFLGTATEGQIEEMIAGWRETLTVAITDAVMKDPVQLMALLPMENFKREGESLEQTTERVAESLHGLGQMMRAVDQEITALGRSGGLMGAAEDFSSVIANINTAIDAAATKFEESAIRLDESGKLIGDPTAMLEAAVTAHDALVARYEAELALIQAITEAIGSLYAGANALVGTAARLQELGVLPEGGMEFVSLLTQFGTSGVGKFATAEQNLVAGGGAVGLFATQSMMAARTLDLAGLETAMISAGNLVTGFTATIDQINQIQDPSERMRLLTEVLGQVGAATEAAARAALTYWQTLHDTVAGMMDQLNAIASSIAAAGGTVASNADWLMKAGIDVKAMGTEMLALIELFPTMGAKLELLASGIQTFIAGISSAEMEKLKNLGIRFGATNIGSEQREQVGREITEALAPMLAGLVNSFTAAMALQDPGQRLSALTSIMDTVGKLLGGLPPELADALTTMFGPEIGKLVEEMKRAAKEQAEHAKLVADELEKIIGDKALSPENFLLLTVQGIKDSLALIVEHAGPLFVAIAEGMVTAGGDIAAAIRAAGIALDSALGGFKTPAEQLSAALTVLSNTMEQKMYDAVKKAIEDALSGSAQEGLEYVPKTGIYMLHQGEAVIPAAQNYEHASSGDGVVVTLSFGDIHLSRGGRQEAEEFIDTIEASIKGGRLRNAVQNAGKGLA